MKRLIIFVIIIFTNSIFLHAADDTRTLQLMLDKYAVNGGELKLEAKEYYITHIEIPAGVSLVGCGSKSVKGGLKGTVIKCIGEESENAIVMNNGSTISGMSLYYPRQDILEDSIKYHYNATIRIAAGSLRNTIRDIVFVNSCRCVDALDHHETLTIEDCCGMALESGIRIHNSTDIDRIQNVHFNYNIVENSGGFMSPLTAASYGRYIRKNATAFIVHRGDWIILDGCFCWGYRYGLVTMGANFDLTAPATQTCVNVVNCGFDACGCCIKSNFTDLLRISNCNCVSFYPGKILKTAKPVDYLTDNYSITIHGGGRTRIDNVNFWSNACGFIHGAGESVHISDCTFVKGDDSGKGHYAIELLNHEFSIEGCLFDARNSKTIKGIKVLSGANILITGNIFNAVNGPILSKSKNVKSIMNNNMFVGCKESVYEYQ